MCCLPPSLDVQIQGIRILVVGNGNWRTYQSELKIYRCVNVSEEWRMRFRSVSMYDRHFCWLLMSICNASMLIVCLRICFNVWPTFLLVANEHICNVSMLNVCCSLCCVLRVNEIIILRRSEFVCSSWLPKQFSVLS